MKKYHIATLLTLLALFLLPLATSAQKQQVGQGAGTQNQNVVQEQAATTSADDSVGQNRVREEERAAENDAGLKVRQQERAEVSGDVVTGTGAAVKVQAQRSEQAREHMGVVAQKVEQLLVATGTIGGIGEQVRVFAQEQNQIRQAVSTSLGKVDKRGGFLKTLIGPDFQSLKEIKKQVTQNEQRVKTLERLKEGATETVKAATDQAIQAMNQETETLRLRVQEEEKTFSFFGWFAKLFVK